RRVSTQCRFTALLPKDSLHRPIGITATHDLATIRAYEVHRITFNRQDELAHLIEPLRRQPALAASALHRKAIRRLLVGAAVLVAALVRVNPQLHRRGYLRQQLGVED